MESSELLSNLERVRWHIARLTFGSSHCTLIGLLVDWWISGNPQTRYALESGPSFGYRSRSEKGGGQCDAILVQEGTSRGIIEVEGGSQHGASNIERYLTTIDKIGKYFAAEYEDLKTLEFGIFLAYPTRKEHMTGLLPMEEFVERGLAVTREHREKQLAMLVLDKKLDTQISGHEHATTFTTRRLQFKSEVRCLKVVKSSRNITLIFNGSGTYFLWKEDF